MKKYKAIIYDIDGTILNTLDMNMYPLMRIIKEEKDEEWSFEDVLKFYSYPGMRVMEELQIKDKEKTYARWVKYVNEYEDGAKLYDGFEDVFQAIDGKMIQAVVSAKTKQQYQIDFVEKGLDRYMKVAILADDTIRHKPDPEPLLECLKRIGVGVEDAIYVGDSYSDYLAASRAHIDFGFAKWGSVSLNDMKEANYIFENPADLLILLEDTN